MSEFHQSNWYSFCKIWGSHSSIPEDRTLDTHSVKKCWYVKNKTFIDYWHCKQLEWKPVNSFYHFQLLIQLNYQWLKMTNLLLSLTTVPWKYVYRQPGSKAAHVLDFNARWWRIICCTTLVVLHQEKILQCPVDRRWGGLQCQCECVGQKTKPCPYRESNSGCSTYSQFL